MIGLELYFKLWNTDPQFNETPTSRVRMAQGNVTVQFISKVRRTKYFAPIHNLHFIGCLKVIAL